MIVQKINDHVLQALDRLLQQYRGMVRIEGIISSLVEQIQDLENAFYPLDQYRQLQFAYGAQLDGLGQIIGLSRNGLSDSEYFILLLGTISENNSDTTAAALLNIVQTVFQATSVFIKTPNSPGEGPLGATPPATVAFGIGNPTIDPSLYPVVEQIILNSLGAAISITYLSTFNAQRAFSTAGPQAWCRGCSDLYNPTPDDGLGAGLIYNNLAQ